MLVQVIQHSSLTFPESERGGRGARGCRGNGRVAGVSGIHGRETIGRDGGLRGALRGERPGTDGTRSESRQREPVLLSDPAPDAKLADQGGESGSRESP